MFLPLSLPPLETDDYSKTSFSLTFTNVDTSSTFSVPITNDLNVEGIEMFSLTLRYEGQGSGPSLLPNVATVTIVDDDGKKSEAR